jgi:hypothetical protein
MHCHNTFHVRVLKPYVRPHIAFPHRTPNDNPPPVLTEDGFDEFEVDDIIDHRILKNGTQKFLVRWKGYDAAHDSWEPAAALGNADELLKKYLNANRISTICTDARGGVGISPDDMSHGNDSDHDWILGWEDIYTNRKEYWCDRR